MARQDREVTIGMTLRITEYGTEFRRPGQPGGTRKAMADRCRLNQRYGVSRARPLARRRASTLRPLRVAMRARKPWLRLRLSTLG